MNVDSTDGDVAGLLQALGGEDCGHIWAAVGLFMDDLSLVPLGWLLWDVLCPNVWSGPSSGIELANFG